MIFKSFLEACQAARQLELSLQYFLCVLRQQINLWQVKFSVIFGKRQRRDFLGESMQDRKSVV